MYLIFDFIFTLKAIHLTGLSRGVKSAAFVLPFSNAEEEIRMFVQLFISTLVAIIVCCVVGQIVSSAVNKATKDK